MKNLETPNIIPITSNVSTFMLGHSSHTLVTKDLFGASNKNAIKPLNLEQVQNLGHKKEEIGSMRRLVKIVIVDPNEDVDVANAVLYNGDEEITDYTDEELFYELDIKELLVKHNDYRVNLVDKKASKSRDKDVLLDKIRIRDLKMIVITIARF